MKFIWYTSEPIEWKLMMELNRINRRNKESNNNEMKKKTRTKMQLQNQQQQQQ